MFKLWATIRKDTLLLFRDKVGLLLMFVMPIILVLVITSIQNSTFELVNENKIPLLVCNKDTAYTSIEFIEALDQIGMFEIKQVSKDLTNESLNTLMHENDVLISIIIPPTFSSSISQKSTNVSSKALHEFGLAENTLTKKEFPEKPLPITFIYNPVLQQSFLQSINGALTSAIQIIEGKKLVQQLYVTLNEKPMPENLQMEILQKNISIEEIAAAKDGSKTIPNATQHNVPAWTIFAMFFIVISLGGSVVKEKLSGSFVRLKTLPTNYLTALLSKQLTYLGVTLLQVFVIFSLGIWIFPYIGLPALNLPADLFGLLIVSLLCGWCAISYAICIGTYSQTQEQANGFGAVSIVILAAISGILVPSFAMPQSFAVIMKLSPLYWCLESYYGLFLERGSLADILETTLPLLGFIVIIQGITLIGLKKKNLI
ncbi:ABC transporter permease [Cytophaga hutchinsonii]|uniref:ABC transporter, permease component n=1 Tax=Cytophaga hutchinsonii (strain ATCC 33406 / DSM 1761 / CIP 103989 / NBRC 15051 / NCIMB 9469 / D465) TaxID=269798 RepID=A0A6N4SN10_CYTH3|nr:ABC transporter permease [Cytophaga hutchinsonii]ABG57676.1 ABC transporter, permease component [Cytophaga hutchinsonii ATCC 33406]SFX02658.1 ABC-2 type transport system permease protein [Cytophaga hutchinsonii ATCC 33406]